MDHNSKSDMDFASELARHDQAISGLQSAVSQIDLKLDSGLNRLFSEISSMKSQPFNWGWAAAGISLLITIGVLTIAPISQELAAASNKIAKHEALFGHPASEERIYAIERRLDASEKTMHEKISAVGDRVTKIADRFYSHQQSEGELK